MVKELGTNRGRLVSVIQEILIYQATVIFALESWVNLLPFKATTPDIHPERVVSSIKTRIRTLVALLYEGYNYSQSVI